MKRSFKRQLSALLLALVMTLTMVPMAGARSSADITYEVEAGEETYFYASDFESFYDANCAGTFRYVTFEKPSSSDYADGYVYYRYGKRSEVYFTRSELEDYKFYYSDSDYGDYDLDDLSFVADSDFEGPVTLSFTVHGSGSRSASGTLVINAKGSSSSSSKGDISYTVKAGEETYFYASDFESFYDANCAGTFRYVTFEKPSSSDYADGYVYYRYGKRSEVYFTRSELEDYKFYYSDSDYGDYDLDDLSFVADSDFEGPVTLSFTVHGSGSRSASGTLRISTKGSTSSSSKTTIVYEVKAGEEVLFDADDFNAVFQTGYSSDLRYIVFDRPSSSDYADGYVYYRYGYRSEAYFTRSELEDYTFYYSDSSYGDYDLDDLSFVADSDFEGPMTLTFTAYGSGSRSVSGTLKITVSGKSSSTAKGDITYTVKAGDEAVFDSADFEAFYDDNCTGSFKYVAFDQPASADYADGYVYYRYGNRNETYFTRSELDDYKFYYSDSDYGDYDLDDLSFVADSDFEGPMTLTFTVYGGSGTRYNQSESGTLVISTESAAVSRYSGNIRYSATPSAALQINANDIARFLKTYTGDSLQYMVLTGIPSTGGLYYNYYGASQYGTTARTQLTASTASGKVFSFSPTSTSEYALSELTYIPSGSNYCTAISFTAYGASGTAASGTILISVTASAVAEVYSVTTKGTSVNFPVSAVYSAVSNATGMALSSIQLLDLPAATAGVLYAGSVKADLTTAYAYSGSGASSMSQLRFVPSSSFTGSVNIPYVALNGRGVAIAAGTLSVGVVNGVKKFNDITTSTWCYKYVTELSSAGIISGYSNGTYQEKNTITYGAALKLIMLAAGYGEQAPTVKNSTFSGYLARAKADGLVSGNPNLNGPITRLQIAQIAAKAMKLSTSNLSNKKPFSDTNDVYVQALNAAGIIEGYFSNGTSTYKPNNTLTRGQVSAIVWRMRNYSR